MKKIILTLILLLTSIFAQNKTITATYNVTYGIIGQLGEATTKLEIVDNKKYKIEVHAYATGIAKVLSFGKEERYLSYGTIENNKLIPSKFIKETQSSYKKRVKEFTFDYKKQIVTIHESKKELKTTYDMNLEPTEKWEEQLFDYKSSYFSNNDLLSLFFNLSHFIPNFNQGQTYDLKAVGANKKDGVINILIPKDKAYEELSESLAPNKGRRFIAYINQEIFSSSRGELLISLNKEGFCNKAVLKDVLIFGDIIGEIKKFEVKES